MKLEHKLIALIFVIALITRLSPVLLFGMPVLYDANYHINISNQIKDTGFLPRENYTYPPLYHVLITSLSAFANIETVSIVMFLLPLISVLSILAFYLLFLKLTNLFNATLGAFLLTVVLFLASASYDSPEVILFLLVPVILLLIERSKKIVPGLLIALSLLVNYLSFIVLLIPLLVSFFKDKKLLRNSLIFLILISLFWILFLKAFSMSEKGVVFGATFVLENISAQMFLLLFWIGILTLPILFYSVKKIKNSFQFYFFLVSLIAFLALIAVPIAQIVRSWEMPKFLAIGALPLIALIPHKKWFKWFLFFFVIFAVTISFSSPLQTIFPKVTSYDLKAINWLEKNTVEGGILAEPAFSEGIKFYSSLDERIITKLPLENDDVIAQKGLYFLSKHGKNKEKDVNLVKEINLKYIILNFEDDIYRKTKFNGIPRFNKIYNVSFNGFCPLAFFGIYGTLCWESNTRILELYTTSSQKYSS